MKNGMLLLKLRHGIFLVMIAFLSPHFMLAAQRRDIKNDKAHLPPTGCVVTSPRKSRAAESPAAFKAAPLSCGELTPEGTLSPNEGATDYDLYVRPEGQVKSVMFFVDFCDAPQTEATTSLFDLFVNNSRQWYETASYGKLSIDVTAVYKWFRMPKCSVSYNIDSGLSFETHKAYIADAIAAADNEIDFKQYQTIYIVASNKSAIKSAVTFTAYAGDGVQADGIEHRSVVTFGGDIRETSPDYCSYVFTHETGHTFGLPDLYAFKYSVYDYQYRYLGGWNIMSMDKQGAMFNAWELQKLGWLDQGQIRCLSAGRYEETVTALEERGGLKALVIPTGPSTAYVIEVRQPIAPDTNLCDKGVLIYKVDARVKTGFGPIVVKAARKGKDPNLIQRCGLLYNATLNLEPGGKSALKISRHLKVKVLGAAGYGYRIRVVNGKTRRG